MLALVVLAAYEAWLLILLGRTVAGARKLNQRTLWFRCLMYTAAILGVPLYLLLFRHW